MTDTIAVCLQDHNGIVAGARGKIVAVTVAEKVAVRVLIAPTVIIDVSIKDLGKYWKTTRAT